ncbi:hypothetical protein GCM10009624_20650 [Gordonia sinesedis]
MDEVNSCPWVHTRLAMHPARANRHRVEAVPDPARGFGKTTGTRRAARLSVASGESDTTVGHAEPMDAM